MKRIYTFLLIICFVLLTACGADKTGREDTALTLSEGEIWIYYVNLDKTELVSRPYRIEENAGVNNQVEALLGSLQTVDMNDEYQSPIPTGINYIGNTMGNKRGKLELEFQIAYDQVDAEGMLFFKTCVAKTLLQLPDVDTVSISLRDIAHLDDDTPVVTENFEDDSFNLSYGNANGYSQSGTIVLFFANETGEQLKAYHKTVEITNNSSLAKIVVESVIAGPDKEGYVATISEDTMIQNISVKDGICYVDLSDEFYSIDNSLKNDIIVYSVVNSLCELPTVSKVQFLKNGEKQPFYRETMPFDGIFERNLDLIEEEEA